MSRSTQYIGLTDDAKAYINENKISEGKQFVICTGMFNEEIIGMKWNLKLPDGPNKAYIAKEEVQDSSWSSGPMIFTRLRLYLIKENDTSIDMGTIFSWVKNPSIKNEYDPIKGQYWI